MNRPRDPGHKKAKPRGSGTYWARVSCRCGVHGTHDLVFSAGDEDSWVVASWLARTLHEHEHSRIRYFLWFTKDPWEPPSPDDISGELVEDDMPF